jgi:hypothetical protein
MSNESLVLQTELRSDVRDENSFEQAKLAFMQRLQNVRSKVITVDNIDNYADEVLTELVDLTSVNLLVNLAGRQVYYV